MTSNATSRVRRSSRLIALMIVPIVGLSACSSGSDGYTIAANLPYKSIRAKNEHMLLVPDIEVGSAGWCGLVPARSSSCGAAQLSIPILEQSWNSAGPPQVTEGSV